MRRPLPPSCSSRQSVKFSEDVGATLSPTHARRGPQLLVQVPDQAAPRQAGGRHEEAAPVTAATAPPPPVPEPRDVLGLPKGKERDFGALQLWNKCVCSNVLPWPYTLALPWSYTPGRIPCVVMRYPGPIPWS